MGKRQPGTPRSRVKSVLRQLWLRSRERAKVLKDHDYRCKECNIKQSRAKGKEVYIEVHHDPVMNWKNVVDIVYERLLNTHQYPLCKACHKNCHKEIEDEENKKRNNG